ncbi:epoxide hydrolase 4-like [Lytechinus variegatus]|uniref:epoxide hydrolase 4-like n=1 Tax=Lytechinus variegatus TaxID=7654 RepID=UPI001BB19EC1|nr:epoxide hydrolase 4-like [Lytechinus variegatus]
MLFLHGFPECWYSWRHQIRAFNKDYHCVAIDMRGVGESDGPPGKMSYTCDLITGDVCELIHVLGHETCILIGHDWGGLIGWKFAAQYPEMVDKYIAMNIPHPDRFNELVSLYLPQIIKSWYIFFFQMPWFPERGVQMGDYNMINEECKHGETTDEDIEAFKYSISRPGRLHTFMNYYRNELTLIFTKTGVVKTPTLLIWGTGDDYLHTRLSYNTEKFCLNLKVERIQGGNHFIQQEQPDLVNQLMKKYLEKEITLEI